MHAQLPWAPIITNQVSKKSFMISNNIQRHYPIWQKNLSRQEEKEESHSLGYVKLTTELEININFIATNNLKFYETCSSGDPNARHWTSNEIAPALTAASTGGYSDLDNKRLKSRRAPTLFCMEPFPLKTTEKRQRELC